ncbi:MAG: hypothetical protein L6366_04560 [Candidatus Omnitrophica bacterium]|nr:hypothetical protein [Candidatus Omnitrophota bacterium]
MFLFFSIIGTLLLFFHSWRYHKPKITIYFFLFSTTFGLFKQYYIHYFYLVEPKPFVFLHTGEFKLFGINPVKTIGWNFAFYLSYFLAEQILSRLGMIKHYVTPVVILGALICTTISFCMEITGIATGMWQWNARVTFDIPYILSQGLLARPIINWATKCAMFLFGFSIFTSPLFNKWTGKILCLFVFFWHFILFRLVHISSDTSFNIFYFTLLILFIYLPLEKNFFIDKTAHDWTTNILAYAAAMLMIIFIAVKLIANGHPELLISILPLLLFIILSIKELPFSLFIFLSIISAFLFWGKANLNFVILPFASLLIMRLRSRLLRYQHLNFIRIKA